MSRFDQNESPNPSARKNRIIRVAAIFLGEDADEASKAPTIEQHWLVTKAGLLLCASGLSAVGYFLFIGLAFSGILPWIQGGVSFVLWLFIVFLDRGVNAIRHGGSGRLKAAAIGVRLLVAMALTSASGLAYTAYFAGERLGQRINVEYQARIAPLVAKRDAGLRDVGEQIRIKRAELAATEKLRMDVAASAQLVGEQIKEQQSLRDKAAGGMEREIPTGKGSRYEDAKSRRDAAAEGVARLADAEKSYRAEEERYKAELDTRRFELDQAEGALTAKKKALDDEMRQDPDWSDNSRDPFMVISALFDLMADPKLGGTARRILMTFGTIILVLEMSFVLMSVIAPAGQYDAKVRYGRNNNNIDDDDFADIPDLPSAQDHVVIHPPGWHQ